MTDMYIRVDVGVIFIRLPTTDNPALSRDDWAKNICKEYPGPYQRIILDLDAMQSINSIVCAGFVHLYKFYKCDEAVLVNVHKNVKSILHTLQLDQVFNIEFKD